MRIQTLSWRDLVAERGSQLALPTCCSSRKRILQRRDRRREEILASFRNDPRLRFKNIGWIIRVRACELKWVVLRVFGLPDYGVEAGNGVRFAGWEAGGVCPAWVGFLASDMYMVGKDRI